MSLKSSPPVKLKHVIVNAHNCTHLGTRNQILNEFIGQALGLTRSVLKSSVNWAGELSGLRHWAQLSGRGSCGGQKLGSDSGSDECLRYGRAACRDGEKDRGVVVLRLLHATPQGRSTYREKMAFLWRSERFELIGDATLYPDEAGVFARPPYASAFRKRADDSVFVASTVHITFGERDTDRVPEIEALGQSLLSDN